MKKNLLLVILLMNVSFILHNYNLAQAESFLTKSEIIKLLSGNSLSGQWNGRAFKQNIHSNGMADVYFNNSFYKIPWKINSKNEYCEDWAELGWYCSKIKNLTKSTITVIRYHRGKKIESIWRWHPGHIDLTRRHTTQMK